MPLSAPPSGEDDEPLLAAVSGQSKPRHRSDSTDATRLLTAVSGRSAALQMCVTLLAHECRLADWHHLHMLAGPTLQLRGSRVGLRYGLGGVVGTVRDAVTGALTSYRYKDRANAPSE